MFGVVDGARVRLEWGKGNPKLRLTALGILTDAGRTVQEAGGIQEMLDEADVLIDWLIQDLDAHATALDVMLGESEDEKDEDEPDLGQVADAVSGAYL